MRMDKKFFTDIKTLSLNYALDFLGQKQFVHLFKIHSIALIGGSARYYFHNDKWIDGDRDIDIDIYFTPTRQVNMSTKMSVFTQGRPILKNYNNKPVDISRFVLPNDSNDFVKDVKEYGKHKSRNSERWRRRMDSPIIFIHPEIKLLENFS
ncbi:MAG: hypothetical protein V3V92_00405 [Candidatus Hydrothermarchaeales archaeon]